MRSAHNDWDPQQNWETTMSHDRRDLMEILSESHFTSPWEKSQKRLWICQNIEQFSSRQPLPSIVSAREDELPRLVTEQKNISEATKTKKRIRLGTFTISQQSGPMNWLIDETQECFCREISKQTKKVRWWYRRIILRIETNIFRFSNTLEGCGLATLLLWTQWSP